MAILERRDKIHFQQCFMDRLSNLRTAMASGHAKKAGGAVNEFFAPVGGVIHARSAGHNPRIGFKIPVRGKRHPMLLKANSRAG